MSSILFSKTNFLKFQVSFSTLKYLTLILTLSSENLIFSYQKWSCTIFIFFVKSSLKLTFQEKHTHSRLKMLLHASHLKKLINSRDADDSDTLSLIYNLSWENTKEPHLCPMQAFLRSLSYKHQKRTTIIVNDVKLDGIFMRISFFYAFKG